MKTAKEQKLGDREEKIKHENTALFKENGFDIVGTLSYQRGWLYEAACYTLKKEGDSGGDVYTACVVRTPRQKPMIASLKKL